MGKAIKKINTIWISPYWLIKYSYSIPYGGGGGGCSQLFSSKETALIEALKLANADNLVEVYQPLVIQYPEAFKLLQDLYYGESSGNECTALRQEVESLFTTEAIKQYFQWKRDVIVVECPMGAVR